MNVIDAENRVAESDESNNIIGYTIPAGTRLADVSSDAIHHYDLSGETFSVDRTRLTPGSQFTVTFSTRNAGPECNPGTRIGVYLSTDENIDEFDTPLDFTTTPAIDANAVGAARQRTVTLPPDTGIGTYYVGVRVLGSDANAQNNSSTGLGRDYARITVGGDAGPVNLRGKPNTFSVSPLTVAPGSPGTIRFAVQNTGSLDSGRVRVNFYLSSDATVTTADQPLGSVELDPIGPANETAVLTHTFPVLSTQAEGNYTVGMVIDPDNAISEANEDDNANQGSGTDRATLRIDRSGTTLPAPVRVGYPQFATGAGPTVRFANPDGSTRFERELFPGFSGEVRTAAADFNGDGTADVAAGTGPGAASRVRILDGVTGIDLGLIDPFEAGFTGGVYVAAGDLDGDGKADLVITPDEGGGPRCRVFSGATFSQIMDFFGIEDPNFRGGARSAVGDVNGDGVGDLVVAAGYQGGPRVAVYDGTSLQFGRSPQHLFGDFFAFEQSLRNGVYVAAGDVNADGYADVIAGGGPGGGPRVTVFDGYSLLTGRFDTVVTGSAPGPNGTHQILFFEQVRVALANFFAGDVNNRGGVRVAVKNLDGDAHADLVVGAGPGAGSRVTAYFGRNISSTGTPATAFEFDAVPGFSGGVFVG